jgi:pimeloyl-ACP methyl ester carboxylesterase
MPDWISGDIETNGIKMHYYRTGDDKPQLVLSHGATDDGLCWTRVACALESEYDVIMPDARGHGLSDAPQMGYTSSNHAADLAGLITGLNLNRPAVGGHSMGAGTTLRLVAEHPELVRCAFLEDPGFRSGAEPIGTGTGNPREAIRAMVVEGRAHGRDAVIARGRANSPTWDDSEFGPWADAKLHVSSYFLDSMRRGFANEWRELLARVQRPVLLITSDPDKGGIVTPETAAAAQQLLPALRVVRLEGAGHNIRRERFDGFVSCIREFLAAH